MWYGLDGQPISVEAAEELLTNLDARRVARTELTTSSGDGITVSTVFLVLDQGLGLWEGPPVLWETMCFGGPVHLEQRRYASRKMALAGHWEVVNVVKLALSIDDIDVVSAETIGGWNA